jgi:hypothetical protein
MDGQPIPSRDRRFLKLPRGDDSRALIFAEREEIVITRDDELRVPGARRSEHLVVIRVASDARNPPRTDDLGKQLILGSCRPCDRG